MHVKIGCEEGERRSKTPPLQHTVLEGQVRIGSVSSQGRGTHMKGIKAAMSREDGGGKQKTRR